MRWQKGRSSDNVVSAGRGGGAKAVGGLGLGGIAITLIIGLILGKSPMEMLSLVAGGASQGQTTAPVEDTETTEFVKKILGSTEDVWGQQFEAEGKRYEEPPLVLFQGEVQSACGKATSAVGPFYCPGDHRVYLDVSFFDELSKRFKASGDFARAYVIAHEVGHHVQNLRGVMKQSAAAKARGASMDGATGLSVRQELQADCYAGVWANIAQKQLNWLDPGDLESALTAATAIGDDRLQKQAQGYVVPDSFTHGTSAQRVRWFKKGFETGVSKVCDTFATDKL